MKRSKLLWVLSAIVLLSSTFSCSDGGGSGSSISSGIVTMSVTDAKPMLPDNVTNFWVRFEEIWVHKSGGGWISLPLAESPYEIDLLQFIEGNTTQLVPPARLEHGKYTQVRIVISEAKIRIDDGNEVNDYDVVIPSGNLKTDKNFIFDVDVQNPAAVDIVVDFDLSMSLKQDNSTTPPAYQCKPVLHLVDTIEAATIYGEISDASFLKNGPTAYVTVFVGDPQNEEVYTKVEVTQETPGVNELFEIFWLVPGVEYYVAIDFDQSAQGAHHHEYITVGSGDVITLNGVNSGEPL
jgi:hypothetical protein